MPDRVQKSKGNDPAFAEPKRRGDCRSIDLGRQGEWQWKTDGRTKAFVYDPSGKRYDIPLHSILGVSPTDWDALQFDWRDETIPIMPNDVGDYIRFQLLKLPKRAR